MNIILQNININIKYKRFLILIFLHNNSFDFYPKHSILIPFYKTSQTEI